MAKKSLGQHWLNDPSTLQVIADAAELSPEDPVLEVGPGLGSLTKQLTEHAGKVIAVEIDKDLVKRLAVELKSDNLEIINADILKFDLGQMPRDYKVVANIPYYLTANLLRTLSTSNNPPSMMVLLVQKEVAERLAARPGQMSLLTVSAQFYYEVKLGRIVPAEMFSPPPKVDSQIVVLHRRKRPSFENMDESRFFRLVKAGFSERRKKLRSSLSGGLSIEKDRVDELLRLSGINPASRAQELSLEQWGKLYQSARELL